MANKKWEEIKSWVGDNPCCASDRLWVPNGWLVRCYMYKGGVDMKFIEDAEHTWNIDY